MRPQRKAGLILLTALCLTWPFHGAEGSSPDAPKVVRAGAAAVDVSPPKLPVLVNGSFLEQKAAVVHDPLFARALVLDDGSTRLAIVVVDSCMMPRALIDQAKELAGRKTGLAVERILVSATHTHSAPACAGALGSRADAGYVAFLPGRIAEAIERAVANLEPAHVGWAVVDDYDHTHCRRWIRRSDKVLLDPFGDPTVRANMHPGYRNPDAIGPAGPVDPGLSIVAVRTPEGRPIALLANYSMHYFGTAAISADYFGRFAAEVARLVAGTGRGGPPFVAMMSQGTSGDQHWMDYARPKDPITIDQYAKAVAERVHTAYRSIEYRPSTPLAMAESRITLRRRTPDERRLAWARPIVAAMGDRPPKSQQEVYAREAVYLHDEPERELKIQALRIGDLGIAAIPDEVYALTGLKIKARSPLVPTFTIELANGSEGYIPPPEQHRLGGYTTWPARTAALEVEAEPKIVAAVLSLLEQVSGRPRRTPREPAGAYAKAVLAAKPLAYWRLGEMDGAEAADASGNRHPASYVGGVALYLEGPPAPGLTEAPALSRAVQFAGGRLQGRLPELGTSYSVEFWFWNGLPNQARDVTGVLFSRAARNADGRGTDRLSLGGTKGATGRLLFSAGTAGDQGLAGTTEIAPKSWHHVVLSRTGEKVRVDLDGVKEIEGQAPADAAQGVAEVVMGESLEGKLAEVAVYARALPPDEAAEHYRAAGSQPENSRGR